MRELLKEVCGILREPIWILAREWCENMCIRLHWDGVLHTLFYENLLAALELRFERATADIHFFGATWCEIKCRQCTCFEGRTYSNGYGHRQQFARLPWLNSRAVYLDSRQSADENLCKNGFSESPQISVPADDSYTNPANLVNPEIGVTNRGRRI